MLAIDTLTICESAEAERFGTPVASRLIAINATRAIGEPRQMQVVQQPVKPTDAQIQAQIENMHWQEKQQEISSAYSRQYQQEQSKIQHQQYMVDHLATPLFMLGTVAIIAFTVIYLVRKAIAAGIQKHLDDNVTDRGKNQDDNASDVRRAREIIEKHEVAAA